MRTQAMPTSTNLLAPRYDICQAPSFEALQYQSPSALRWLFVRFYKAPNGQLEQSVWVDW